MARVIGWPGGGQQLGEGIYILFGKGAPAQSQTADVLAAQIGSLYLQTDAVAGGSTVWALTPNGWTAIV